MDEQAAGSHVKLSACTLLGLSFLVPLPHPMKARILLRPTGVVAVNKHVSSKRMGGNVQHSPKIAPA